MKPRLRRQGFSIQRDMSPRRDRHPDDVASYWWDNRFLERFFSKLWSLALCSPAPQAGHAWSWGSRVQSKAAPQEPRCYLLSRCPPGSALSDRQPLNGFLASKYLLLLSNPAVLYILVALWFQTKQNTSLMRIPVVIIPGGRRYCMAFAELGTALQRLRGQRASKW